MKKLLQFLFLFSFSILLSKNQMVAQTVTQNIFYGPFTTQCCSSNHTAYYCFNDAASSACGGNVACNTQTFTNPVPAGNIVTNVQAVYYTAGSNSGNGATSTLNGTALNSYNQTTTTGFGCGSPWTPTGGPPPTIYPCGAPGYNNAAGATETFQVCFTGQVCISEIQLVFTYAPANQAVTASVPSANPSGPTSVCSGVSNAYSCPTVANATGYTWSINPSTAGTINSGQGTQNVTASFTAAGQICVYAYNLCGPSAPVCTNVSIIPPATQQNTPTASTNPICPGNSTTLSIGGGTLGGGNYTWYAGSCNSGVIGTGSSITVSPSSATTYYVDIVGTCNTTACTSILVNVNGVQPTPSNPSGASGVCSGSTQVYTTIGSGGYNWTVPAGTTINSGQGTTSINVTIGSTAGNICVTSTGACGTSAAACTPITITSTPSSPTSITGTTPVCLGSDNYSVGAVAGATSYSWSVTGGGTVTGGQGTTAATINWTTAGSWTVNCAAVNSCGNSVAATFPITINPHPNITITPSSTATCSGASSVTFTSNNGVTYTWTSADPTLNPLTGSVVTASPTNTTAPTVYNVTGTDGNGCTNTANVSITVNPTPTVTVAGGGSSSQVVCSGNAVSPINFNVTPAGTVIWTNNNTAIGLGAGPITGNTIAGYTAPTVTVQTIGIITANATSSSGCTSTANTDLTYTITINSPPGPPVLIGGVTNPMQECQNVSPAVTLTVAPAGGAIPVWYHGTTFLTTGNTYIPPNSTVGTTVYTVIDSAAATGCGAASGGVSLSVTVTINPLPSPPIFTFPTTANDTSCQGSPPTLTVNSGTATAVWYSNNTFLQTGSSYTPLASLAPGTYTYSIIDSIPAVNGCINAPPSANTTTLSLTVKPSPIAPVLTAPTGTNNIYCQGSPTPLTVSTGTATPTPVAVWYSNNAVVNIGTSYTPPANLTAGQYTYSVIDSIPAIGGCTNAPQSLNTTTLMVTVNPIPPTPTLSLPTTANDSVCQGVPITLSVNTGTTVPTPVASWYTGNVWLYSGSNYTPAISGLLPGVTYTYSIIDSIPGGGCVNAAPSLNTTTVSLYIKPAPATPTVTGSQTITECQYLTPAQSFTAQPAPGSVAVWYNANGTAVAINTNTYAPSDNVAGNNIMYYLVDSSTTNGCTSAPIGGTIPLSVTINPTPTTPTLTTAADTTLSECQLGTATTLTVIPAVGSTPVWYNTNTGAVVAIGSSFTPPNAVASPPSIIYSVIDSATTLPATWCKSSLIRGNALTITVTVHPAPTINVTNQTNLDSANCGKVGTLTVSPSAITGLGTPPLHYQWYANGTAIPHDTTLVLTTGTTSVTGTTYSLQVTDSLGCHAIAAPGTGTTFTVPSVASPVILFTINPDSAVNHIPYAATFTNQTTTVSGNLTYTWTYGDGLGSNLTSPTHTYTSVGNYTVMLIASNGSCIDTATKTIITEQSTMIIIPNIFSPNGDNINDVFFIINTGMSSLNCTIFNRWGQLLYTITAPNQGWDGKTPNGDNAPDGTYMYILQAQGLNGKTYKQNGTVTLVR
jgi:gliding motility-associated-like protein